MLGSPDGVSACPFDLDGVLTDTADVVVEALVELLESPPVGVAHTGA